MSTQRTSASGTKSRAARRARKPQPEKPAETGQHAAHSLLDAKLYVNRELSLLAFQKRVLEEAQDPHNPLLERVKFFSILGSNMHCKTALVVRREGSAIRRYLHLSTGNYNSVTAQLYTDIGMFTCDEGMAADCSDLFNYLTGYSAKADYRKLLVAPLGLRAAFERLIRREVDHQRGGRRGRLIFKMNALVDERMIQLLYEASQAGVEIDLLVRGICCFAARTSRRERSYQGHQYRRAILEHSRIFYFRNAGQEEVYLGSADMMPRNLDRRVEVAFPVGDPSLVRFLHDEVLAIYLADVAKARHMKSDGTYDRPGDRNSPDSMNSQEWFIRKLSTAQQSKS